MTSRMGKGRRIKHTDPDLVYRWLQAGRVFELSPCRVVWVERCRKFCIEVCDGESVVGYGDIGATAIVSRRDARFFDHADDALQVATVLSGSLNETQEWCLRCPFSRAVLSSGMLSCPRCKMKWSRE